MSANLYSTDAFELLLGIAEGEIAGIAGDTHEEQLQNIYIDDIPLFASGNGFSGENNFDDSQLIIRFEPGTPFTAIEDAAEGQTPIWYAFGGQNITVSVDRELSHNIEITELTETTAKGFDSIEVRFYIARLARFTDDGTKKNNLRLQVQYRKVGDTNWTSYIKEIEGKVTVSPITRTYKFDLPRTAPSDRYEIRVTKLNEDSTDKKVADVSWVGYELLTKSGDVYVNDTIVYDQEDLEYHPNTAMLQVVGVLGEQITRVPSISAVYKGLLCTVPSNYDSVNKTYDETQPWDGSFKPVKEFTDNPFWIAHELTINTRIGIAKYNPRVVVNRYSVYDKAKYADGYNPLTGVKDLTNSVTGESGVARYTFNAVISEQRDGVELINYILGTAFAKALDSDDGEILFVMDMPETPVATVIPEMCVDFTESSPFSYAFSDLESRYNAITSSYIDAKQDYQPRFVGEIQDSEAVNKYGLNVHEYQALGCTNEWECQRKMYFFLSTVQNEVTTVTFRVPLHGIEYQPFDVINIVDPELGNGLSGRMVSSTSNTVTVRDPLYFDVAGDYLLTLQGIETDYEFTITITAGELGLGLTTFTLDSALPSADNYNDYPPISISTLEGNTTPVGFPKPWRITSITDLNDPELPNVYEVTASEIDTNKHSNADLLAVSEMPQYSFMPKYRPTRVANLRILEQEHIKTSNVEQVNLWIGWDEVKPLAPGGYYEVFVTENTQSAKKTTYRTQESAFEVQGIQRGEIEVSVVTHFGDMQSAPVTNTFDTNVVLASDLLAKGAVPTFATTYENDTLQINTTLNYSFGSESVNTIDLIAAGAVRGVRYTVYDDRDPGNRTQLFNVETNGPVTFTPQDFYKAIGHDDYAPSSLYVEVRIVDLEEELYPALGQNPFTVTIAPAAANITNLTHTKLNNGVTFNRITWDDTNYGYEVTLFKPDGKSILTKVKVYDAEFNTGVLPIATGYKVQVRGFNANKEFSNPATVLFNVTSEITPTAEPAISNEDGVIILTPVAPSLPQYAYEFKYSLTNNIGTAKSGNKGLSVTINGTLNGATYYVWYRLVSLDGTGAWIQKQIVAEGQTLYTWKVFADDETGTNISTTADTKPFVGILSGQLTATPDISDPSIYAWLRNTSTEWLFGDGVPSAALGNIGDSYLEQSTGNIYKKTESGWGSPIGNLAGGDGDKFWSGPYDPTDPENTYQTTNGDIFINSITFELFQKVSGSWVSQGVMKGADGAPGSDGIDSAFFNGFETQANQDALVIYSGVSKTLVTDPFSGTYAMELSSTVAAGDTSGNGDTAYIEIPERIALLFAGQKVVVSVVAKQGDTNPATQFGLAYSTAEVGNSGFTTFNPTTSFQKFSLEYDVPLPNVGGPDYLILNPDLSGGGGNLVVDHFQVSIKGEKGDTGDNAQLYYIGYPNGSVLKNGVGTITLETHFVDGSSDTVLTGSTDPQLYDGTTALGRSVVLGEADINGSKVITLKNGSTILDSITVGDLNDGVSATYGTVTYTNALAWTQDKNSAASWTPSTYTSNLTFDFIKDGSVIASRVIQATLDPETGAISASHDSNSGQATTYTISKNGTRAVSIIVTHTASGAKAAERLMATASGAKGDNGVTPSVALLEEESTAFLAQPGGTLDSGQLPYTNKFQVLEGTTDVTTDWTLDWAKGASDSVSMTLASDGTITLNSLGSDVATLTITASRTGYTTLNKKWTVFKQKKGNTGPIGPGLYEIENTDGAFPDDGTATAAFTAKYGYAPKTHDHLTYHNADNTYSEIKRYTSSDTWETPSLVLNGSMFTKGTVTASAFIASDTESGVSITIDPKGASKFSISKNTTPIVNLNSADELYIKAGLAAGTIKSTAAFSPEVLKQIQNPLTEGSTGGSFSGADDTGASPLTSTVLMTNVNLADVTASFLFQDLGFSSGATPPVWDITIKYKKRADSGSAWSSLTTLVNAQRHNGYKTSEGEYGLTVNYSDTFSLSGLTLTGDVEFQISAVKVSGTSNNPRLAEVTTMQEIQGGGVAGEATTLNGKQGSYYLNWNNFTNLPVRMAGLMNGDTGYTYKFRETITFDKQIVADGGWIARNPSDTSSSIQTDFGNGAPLAPIFTEASTDKQYIRFSNPSGNNDPAFVMHETGTTGADTNKGVLHLCPSDDASATDYVYVHGTNDDAGVIINTNGGVQGYNKILELSSSNNDVYIKPAAGKHTRVRSGHLLVEDGNIQISGGGHLYIVGDGASLRLKPDNSDEIRIHADGNEARIYNITTPGYAPVRASEFIMSGGETNWHSGNLDPGVTESVGVKDVLVGNRSVYKTGIHTYNTMNTTTGQPSGGGVYGSSIVWGKGTAGSVEIWGGWVGSNEGLLYTRSLRNTTDNWSEWYQLFTSKSGVPWDKVTSLPAQITDLVNSGTYNGAFTINQDNTDSLKINKSAGDKYSGVQFQTNYKTTWLLYTANNGTEDLGLQYKDPATGNYVGTALTVYNATGKVKLFKGLEVGGDGIKTDVGAYTHLGGTIHSGSTAPLQVNGFQRTGDIYLHEGNDNAKQEYKIETTSAPLVRFTEIKEGNGYVEIGASDTSWARLQTDLPNFYFNKAVYSQGGFYVHAQRSKLTPTSLDVGEDNNNYSRLNNNADLIYRNQGWANNTGEVTILRNGYTSGTGDFMLLRATGNSTTNGALVIGRNIFAVGQSDYTDPNSSGTQPLKTANWMAVNASDVYLQGKTAFRMYDSWLRINDLNAFGSGVYLGNGVVKTDGTFQHGAAGANFLLNSQQAMFSVPVKLNEIHARSGNLLTIGAGELGQYLRAEAIARYGEGAEYTHIGGEAGVVIWSSSNNADAENNYADPGAGMHSVKLLDSAGNTVLNETQVKKLNVYPGADESNMDLIGGNGRYARMYYRTSDHKFGFYMHDSAGAITTRLHWDGQNDNWVFSSKAEFNETAQFDNKTYFNSELHTSSGIRIEGDKHHINVNDGSGNFNIKVGVKYGTGNYCSENGYGSHVSFNQGTGTWIFAMADAAKTTGEAYTFSHVLKLEPTKVTLGKDTTVSGEITATEVTATSDKHVKSKLKVIVNATDKTKALTGYTYNHKTLSGRRAGIIAQDLQKILPEGVRTDSDGMLSVNPMATIALLVNAVNELTARVEQLEDAA